MRGGLRKLSRSIDTNIDCALVENEIVFVVPNIEGPGPPFTIPTSVTIVRPKPLLTAFIIDGRVVNMLPDF